MGENEIDKWVRGHPKIAIWERMIQISAEYVIGDGILYAAQSPQVQRVLDAHWTDPTNKWPIYQYERIRDWGLLGEMCIPAYVNKENGHVTLGNIDTELIDRVIPDPVNTMKSYAVLLKKIRGETHRRAYKIIDVANVSQDSEAFGRWVGLPETDEEKTAYGFDFKKDEEFAGTTFSVGRIKAKWAGSCFFFTLNNTLSADRGWSDLLSENDWMDAHDQLLFSTVEKAIHSSHWVEDILLRGMNQQQQEEWKRKQPKSKPGRRFTHNENIEMSIKSPDLRLEDVGVLAGVVKNHVLAGGGYPPIWFAESLTSRASAPEMTEPAFKHLKMRQRYSAYAISTIFRFVLDQAVLKGGLRLSEKNSGAFYLVMPEVSAKDQRMLSIVIKNVASAIKEAIDIEVLEKEEAQRIFRLYLEMSGIDAWKNEPRYQRGPMRTPDEEFTADSVFKHAKESSMFEQSAGGRDIYVFLDNPNARKSQDLTDPSDHAINGTAEVLTHHVVEG